MGKHKKTSHHKKPKDGFRSHDKKEKVHKHKKKKKKRSRSSDSDSKQLCVSKRRKSSKRPPCIPEVLLADSDDDITIIFDSREQANETSQDSSTTASKSSSDGEIKIVEENLRITNKRQRRQHNENSSDSVMVLGRSVSSEVTIVHEDILITDHGEEEIRNIPLPNENTSIHSELTEPEIIEVSSIPLPIDHVAPQTVNRTELQAAIGLVELSGSDPLDGQSASETVDGNRTELQAITEPVQAPGLDIPDDNNATHEAVNCTELQATVGLVEDSSSEENLKVPTNHPNHHVNTNRPKRRKKRKASEKRKLNLPKRSWQYTTIGAAMSSADQFSSTPKHLVFDVLNYNVLSQSIMEDHPDLYSTHDPQALDWKYRSQLLMNEFKIFNADILCLQEVEESHLKSFYNNLHNKGYSSIYKQRTGGQVDGVAIYFKNAVFDLTDHATVEYYQPDIDVLDRHNVGLVAKLAPKVKPEDRIVVATTHLLFNPRRHDVKLAQTQLLLAEVERFAFKGFDPRTGVAQYWPVILTGDLNLEPHTAVYQLLNTGFFKYEGLDTKTLSSVYGRTLSKEFLPRDLLITDSCQHWNLLRQRRFRSLDHKSERPLLKLYNSDYNSGEASSEVLEDDAECSSGKKKSDEAVCFKELPCLNQSDNEFSTGKLRHHLNLKSVYNHDPERWYDNSQVTTFQERWVLVDYIFYSSLWEQYLQQKAKDNLKLLARYRLFSEEEAQILGPIPNLRSPSDHYPLCAKFALLLT